ncbi:MAG TPA: hypothetical protein VJT49_00790 [Amycolatopsis sp.]|uniref:hypothetical protein n=1 Tax=Amycolatopsis sp. TaxID=37632 RepID=UPI002B46ABD8|nr:hypothetical protein [Amycolatopsis sp.]HKS43652.1 hypothetical protein [Amycolatopsis sp.]
MRAAIAYLDEQVAPARWRAAQSPAATDTRHDGTHSPSRCMVCSAQTWPASEIDRLARRLKVLAEYAHARQASAPATGEDTIELAARVLHATRCAQWSEVGVQGSDWDELDEQIQETWRRDARGLAAAGLLAAPTPADRAREWCVQVGMDFTEFMTERDARKEAETSRAHGFQARVLSREIGEWRPSERQPNIDDRVTAERYTEPGIVTGRWCGLAKFDDQEFLTDDDGVDHYIKAGTCVPAEEADNAQ